MPIDGLTNGTPSFREIGRLRKGAPKSDGKLQDLNYFRPDFRPNETEAFRKFLDVYGDKPTKIEAFLAFDRIDLCWDANWEVYNTRGLLGMADGTKWTYLRSNKNGELLVRDGEVLVITDGMQTVTDESGRLILPFDPKMPVYSYKGGKDKNQDIGVFPRPTGKLKLLLPRLGMLNYVTLLTHSWYDCANISNELAAVAQIAQAVNLTPSQIPLVVTRSTDKVSVNINGQKSMSEKSLVHVDIDPVFAQLYISVIARSKLQPIAPGESREVAQLPAPPEGANEDGEEELETASQPVPPEPDPIPEPAAAQPAAPAPQPAPQPAPAPTPKSGLNPVEDIGSEFNLAGQALWPGLWQATHKQKIVNHHTIDGQFSLEQAVSYLKGRITDLEDNAKFKAHIRKSWPWAPENLIDELLAQLIPVGFVRTDLVHAFAYAQQQHPDLLKDLEKNADLRGQVGAIILSDLPPF